MGNTGHPRNQLRSSSHFGGLHCITFETNSTSNPDGLVDPGNLVSSVTRAAVGKYTIRLRDEFRRVQGWAQYEEIPDYTADAGYNAYVRETADGGGVVATLTVQVENAIGQPFDTTDKTIAVWIWTDSRYVT